MALSLLSTPKFSSMNVLAVTLVFNFLETPTETPLSNFVHKSFELDIGHIEGFVDSLGFLYGENGLKRSKEEGQSGRHGTSYRTCTLNKKKSTLYRKTRTRSPGLYSRSSIAISQNPFSSLVHLSHTPFHSDNLNSEGGSVTTSVSRFSVTEFGEWHHQYHQCDYWKQRTICIPRPNLTASWYSSPAYTSIQCLYGFPSITTQLFSVLHCFFSHKPTSPYPSKHAMSAIINFATSPSIEMCQVKVSIMDVQYVYDWVHLVDQHQECTPHRQW